MSQAYVSGSSCCSCPSSQDVGASSQDHLSNANDAYAGSRSESSLCPNQNCQNVNCPYKQRYSLNMTNGGQLTSGLQQISNDQKNICPMAVLDVCPYLKQTFASETPPNSETDEEDETPRGSISPTRSKSFDDKLPNNGTAEINTPTSGSNSSSPARKRSLKKCIGESLSCWVKKRLENKKK